MDDTKQNQDRLLTIILLLTSFICMSVFALIQPFGDGPDEINRFKVVEYIYRHGVLPVGDDPEILIDGYGASYAFQPILTYILDGFLLRTISFLHPSLEMRVLISRFVNIFFGLVMALYVKKISRLIFSDRKAAWAFTLAIVWLPQNLFLHSYVNTDSMGLLSVSIILYAILAGMRDHFSLRSSLHLSFGTILCALSYYNCYGVILCAIFAFFMHFISFESSQGKKQTIHFRWKECLQKGFVISAIVLLFISWWFIRNALLYHGDFLALDARQLCAANTCIEEYNPLTRDTYRKLGIPVLQMIFGTDYYTLVWKSFIAMFGPMRIPTHHYIYMGFKYWFIAALIGFFLPRPKQTSSLVLAVYNKSEKIIINSIFLTAMILPAFLAVYYSYTWEFQPQGRYFHPMLIPFMYFLTIGIQNLFHALSYLTEKQSRLLKRNQTPSRFTVHLIHNKTASGLVSLGLYHFLYAFLGLSLLYSVFVAFCRYYLIS